MSHTFYAAIDVFTTEITAPHLNSTAAVPDKPLELVVVITNNYSDEYLHLTPIWAIDFIGDTEEFVQNYIPRVVGHARHQVSHSAAARLDEGYRRRLLENLEKAQPLKVQDLWTRAHRAYAWSSNDYARLTRKAGKVVYQQYGQTWYGATIETQDDVQRLVTEAYEIKCAIHLPNGPYHIDRLKLGIPRKVPEDTLQIHRRFAASSQSPSIPVRKGAM